jgi:hypothetical protein
MISPNTVASVASAIALTGTREGRWAEIPLYTVWMYMAQAGIALHCMDSSKHAVEELQYSPVCIFGSVSLGNVRISPARQLLLLEGVG